MERIEEVKFYHLFLVIQPAKVMFVIDFNYYYYFKVEVYYIELCLIFVYKCVDIY